MKPIILAISLLAISWHAHAASMNNNPGGPPWMSGVGQIPMPTGYQSWRQQFMGYDADIMAVWVSSHSVDTWDQFRTGKGGEGTYLLNAMALSRRGSPSSFPIRWCRRTHSNRGCKNPAVWDQFARGEFDDHYRVMAQNFKKLAQQYGRDPSNHVFRLGWEMNGEHYPWSICTKVTEFKQSWERATRIIRAEIPGVLFDFSPAHRYVGYTTGLNYNGSAGVNLAGFLPDPSTYDVISISHHDVRPFTTSDSVWQSSIYDPPKSARKIGLKELVDTATANGKKFALTEWAPQMADCGDDHPQSADPALFLKKTYEFLWANRSKVAWDTYFATACTQLHNRSTTDAARTYKELWGSGGAIARPIPPQPTPPQQVKVE